MRSPNATAAGSTHKNFQLPCRVKAARIDHTAAQRSQKHETRSVPTGSRPEISADPSRHSIVPLMGTAVLRRVPNQLLPKQKTAMFGSINLKRPDSVSWIVLLVLATWFGDRQCCRKTIGP